MKRKLTRHEQSCINRLEKVFETWPNSLELFGDSGTLLVVDISTMEVIKDDFPKVVCDGGDPVHSFDDDGVEYINLNNQKESEEADEPTDQ